MKSNKWEKEREMKYRRGEGEPSFATLYVWLCVCDTNSAMKLNILYMWFIKTKDYIKNFMFAANSALIFSLYIHI